MCRSVWLVLLGVQVLLIYQVWQFLCQMVLTGLLLNSGVWHLVYCYGNEILQLQKGNARDNCRCQVTTCPLFLSVSLNKYFSYLWIILF